MSKDKQQPKPPVAKTCAGCAHYRQGRSLQGMPVMECRRFPPVPVGGLGHVQVLFPQPKPEDYCAEFSPRQG